MEISKVTLMSAVLLSLSAGAMIPPLFQVYVANFPLDEEGNLRVTQMNGEQNVTITNWLIATNHLTVMLNETYKDVNRDPEILGASNEVVGIGNKSVTFLSGGVSGGVVFEATNGYYDWGLAGGSSGAGRVEVYDSNNTLLAHFSLPLSSLFALQNVDKIKVYAEAPIPVLLTGWNRGASYSACVVASVYWIEQ